jgi:ribonucleoside-triphosphate reductase
MSQFHLTDSFLDDYKDKKPPFGYRDAAGNSVGEIVFLRTYARLKEDGTKERWWEVCERVVSGMFEIQRQHCLSNRLPWDSRKAQRSAREAFDRMFNLKWTPPGRGLWIMGTPMVMRDRDSTGLQNCAFISTNDMTRDDPGAIAAFLMEASMCGVGVGFDVFGAEKNFVIHTPGSLEIFDIPDTRQGWAESVRLLFNSYFVPNSPTYVFTYARIRGAGEPIKTFGGVAAGPEPLKKLHEDMRSLFDGRAGDYLSELDIMDVMNQIGVCVVAGNVRRSAELALGRATDNNFITAKAAFPYRTEWSFMSNNSVMASVGDNLDHLVDSIALNGEPGVVWMDVTRAYGRLADRPDHRDHRAAGYNPCAEQSLESGECCTLVEVFLNRHTDLGDFERTLKYAYLYAKTVTLMPTTWDKTNAIMQRNRRLGVGVSGIANFADNQGLPVLRDWMDIGYKKVRDYDRIYSEWLCVRESIKLTTVKPSGTVSILAGESPGVHWSPGGEYFKRGIVFAKNDPMVNLLEEAGYSIEPYSYDKNSVFVQFEIHSGAKRSEKDVSIFEKINLASFAQRWWSDNSVSCTVTFDAKEEAEHVGTVLSMHEGNLKTISFLPMGDDVYPQMPYQSSDENGHEAASMRLFPIDFSSMYNGTEGALDAQGERFCTTDKCELPTQEV